MKNCFPNLFDKGDLNSMPKLKETDNFTYNVDSGENAIRLLLRSLNLNIGDSIAVPAFVCHTVWTAIEKEKLKPVAFDLKSDSSFWTDYDFERIISEKISAVIVVHLYGYIHPDTDAILEYCKEKTIPVIHDAAQSYGVDENLMKGGGVVYSFGPGKSSTAANGAIIVNSDLKDLYLKMVKQNSMVRGILVDSVNRFFVKSRTYDYETSFFEKLSNKIMQKLFYKMYQNDLTIYSMTDFQLKMAELALKKVSFAKKQRRKRFDLIVTAVKGNSNLIPAFNSFEGLYFKTILFVKTDENRFKDHLIRNNIYFFRLFDSKSDIYPGCEKLIQFNNNCNRFFEFSSEATIPVEEIVRVAQVIKDFK